MVLALLKKFIKFFIIYYILGMVALWLTVVCISFSGFMEKGYDFFENLDAFSFLIKIKEVVPFENLFEIYLTNGGPITEIFSFFSNINEINVFSVFGILEIFKELAVVSVASFCFFLFSRLNKFFGKIGSWSARIGYYAASVFWLIASYSVSEFVIKVLTEFFSAIKPDVLYVAIFVFFLLAHAVAFAKGESGSGTKIFVILAIKMLCGFVKTMLAWKLCGYLMSMFQGWAAQVTWGFILIILILAVVNVIEEELCVGGVGLINKVRWAKK